MKACDREGARMAVKVRAGGAGATPLAGSGNLLGCLGADICGAENAGLAGFGVGFFGACGLYGGSAENVWGDGRPMGIC